jgi:hypothetical protein
MFIWCKASEKYQNKGALQMQVKPKRRMLHEDLKGSNEMFDRKAGWLI